MSQLLDFYRGTGRDSERRNLSEIWAWDDPQFEYCHDFIQWLFPLDEPSAVNADAPLVTAEDQAAFRSERELQAAMRRSFVRFISFVGLKQTDDGRIIRGPNFDQRQVVWRYQNHNWLRITRVIKSLRLLGFENEARAFWVCLKNFHDIEGYDFGHSFDYWKDAAAGLDR